MMRNIMEFEGGSSSEDNQHCPEVSAHNSRGTYKADNIAIDDEPL